MKDPFTSTWNLARKIGSDPRDTEEQRIRKQTLVMISTLIGIAGIVWGIMYLSLSLTLAAIYPFIYSFLITLAIIAFHITKKITHFLITELVLILLLPFFLQWSLGGFEASGAVMVWAFLAPMGAIMFQGVREAVAWLIAYIVLIAISLYFDGFLATGGPDISNQNRLLFFSMNITGVSIITFSSFLYFVSEQIRDKARNVELLEETRKNKLEIEQQHAQLADQRDALIAEQEKTEKLLREIETMFGQHVSEEVAKELVSSEGEMNSQLCNVTVMFLDIRDFTSFADSKSPDEVAKFQNIVFSELIDIVREHKGVVYQIMGDGLMAVFGSPVLTTTHATDAVMAGYAMIGKVSQLGEEGHIPEIRVGLGMHTGQVLAGNIGNQFRKQYSLTGSTVIVAARIEQLNKTYDSQFLISGDLYGIIRHRGYPTQHLGPVELKGIGKPTEIYRLV